MRKLASRNLASLKALSGTSYPDHQTDKGKDECAFGSESVFRVLGLESVNAVTAESRQQHPSAPGLTTALLASFLAEQQQQNSSSEQPQEISLLLPKLLTENSFEKMRPVFEQINIHHYDFDLLLKVTSSLLSHGSLTVFKQTCLIKRFIFDKIMLCLQENDTTFIARDNSSSAIVLLLQIMSTNARAFFFGFIAQIPSADSACANELGKLKQALLEMADFGTRNLMCHLMVVGLNQNLDQHLILLHAWLLEKGHLPRNFFEKQSVKSLILKILSLTSDDANQCAERLANHKYSLLLLSKCKEIATDAHVVRLLRQINESKNNDVFIQRTIDLISENAIHQQHI